MGPIISRNKTTHADANTSQSNPLRINNIESPGPENPRVISSGKFENKGLYSLYSESLLQNILYTQSFCSEINTLDSGGTVASEHEIVLHSADSFENSTSLSFFLKSEILDEDTFKLSLSPNAKPFFEGGEVMTFKKVNKIHLTSGKKAINNYLIGEMIGSGSHAKVFQCEDLFTHKQFV